GRRLHLYLRLGLLDPGHVLLQALLGLSDGGKQQVEAFAVGGAEGLAEGLGLVADAVEDALAVLDAGDLAGDLVFRAVDEQVREGARGPRFGGDLDALAVPRQAAGAQRQRGEARLAADLRGDLLVERDGVANVVEADAIGADAGEDGDLGVMAAGVAAVRH